MNKSHRFWLMLVLMAIGIAAHAAMQVKPAEIEVAGASIATRVLVRSPAETVTDLQVICLFEASAESPLKGALLETNEKLKGLLERIRKPTLFRGELGETIVVAPPAGTLGAKKLLIIGLGDAEAFTPQKMNLVGSIVYRESTRMGIADPYFAPTVLDGGVTKFSTGEVAENFVAGFLRAARTEKLLTPDSLARAVVQSLTFLAGPSHAADTAQGIERAFARRDE
jgi:hypothetical protein